MRNLELEFDSIPAEKPFPAKTTFILPAAHFGYMAFPCEFPKRYPARYHFVESRVEAVVEKAGL